MACMACMACKRARRPQGCLPALPPPWPAAPRLTLSDASPSPTASRMTPTRMWIASGWRVDAQPSSAGYAASITSSAQALAVRCWRARPPQAGTRPRRILPMSAHGQDCCSDARRRERTSSRAHTSPLRCFQPVCSRWARTRTSRAPRRSVRRDATARQSAETHRDIVRKAWRRGPRIHACTLGSRHGFTPNQSSVTAISFIPPPAPTYM